MTSASSRVIVLHGLGLNTWWMAGMAGALARAGHVVDNLDYPSTRESFESIVDTYIKPVVDAAEDEKVSFVAHSMGGLLVRFYAQRHGAARIGRVVMLGTPNRGSEIADYMKHWALFRWMYGAAGQGLGTQADAVWRGLPPVPFECGVIAGDFSALHFPLARMAAVAAPCDGVVSVESTRVAGMKAHVVVHADHSMMVWRREVWHLTRRFLETGDF